MVGVNPLKLLIMAMGERHWGVYAEMNKAITSAEVIALVPYLLAPPLQGEILRPMTQAEGVGKLLRLFADDRSRCNTFATSAFGVERSDAARGNGSADGVVEGPGSTWEACAYE